MKTAPFRVLLVLDLLACGPSLLALDEKPSSPASALDIGLTENAERRLMQLDVTIRGPEGITAELTRENFVMTLGGRTIEDFVVDRRCHETPSTPGAEPLAPANVGESASASYLFFFDQHHLTLAGRERSLELARELVERLVRNSSRAMIVSSGRTLRTFAPLTADRSVLLAALEALEHDEAQSDSYATLEEQRVDELQETQAFAMDAAAASNVHDSAMLRHLGELRDEGVNTSATKRAVEGKMLETRRQGAQVPRGLARQFQREEQAGTDRALNLFASALDRLSDVPLPKAAIYFADRMRSNAGAHYLRLFGTDETVKASDPREEAVASFVDSVAAVSGDRLSGYERVIVEANRRGVRLYTVAAEGLIAPAFANRHSSWLTRSEESTSPLSTVSRFSDAEDGLLGFAAETGGRAFLRGIPAAKIADGIVRDLACLYVISFDAGQVPEDRRLDVRVWVNRPDVRVQTRSSMIRESRSAKRQSRLLAAFTGSADSLTDSNLQAVVIPTGFRMGRYSALVQVSVRGLGEPQAEWELGFSIVAGGQVVQQASGKIAVDGADVPVVFEQEVSLPPRAWELIAVARHTRTDQIATARVEGNWHAPTGGGVTVGPFVLLQPSYGVFLRDGQVRREGYLGPGGGRLVDASQPTALVGIVCRDRSHRGPLKITRQLSGDSAADFPAIDFDSGSERCAVIRDVIPGETMTSGEFHYELRVLSEQLEIASQGQEFAALNPSDGP